MKNSKAGLSSGLPHKGYTRSEVNAVACSGRLRPCMMFLYFDASGSIRGCLCEDLLEIADP